MAERTVAEPQFVDLLVTALKRELPGADVNIEHVRANRYRFVVTWERFDAMGHPERQKLVWDIAERVVPREDLWNVGMILTLGQEDLPSD
jgi:hypothetical protein